MQITYDLRDPDVSIVGNQILVSDYRKLSLLEECPYLELFWYAFSRIQEKYFSPYSVQMREYTDQNNSEYGHFLHSVCDPIAKMISIKCKSLE